MNLKIMNLKKNFFGVITVLLMLGVSSFTGCSSEADNEINVVSRESGSGTRSAFIEITHLKEKDSSGKKKDHTYAGAVIQNSTNGVLMTVSQDENAVGYISLGSFSDIVKVHFLTY